MTPWQNRVTPIVHRLAEDMKLRNLAQATIDSYTYHVGKFAEFLGKPLDQVTPEDVRSFQLHLIEERKVGFSSFNQAVCGLRFLYRFTFPKPWPVTMIYLHVRRPHLDSTPSPIDWLPVRQVPRWMDPGQQDRNEEENRR